MIPFQQKWYYTPKMKGSYSIKYVLPALVPGLSYNDLPKKEGATAYNTFLSMVNETFEGDLEETKETTPRVLRDGHLRYGQNSGETTTRVKLIFFQKIEKIYFLKTRFFPKNSRKIRSGELTPSGKVEKESI